MSHRNKGVCEILLHDPFLVDWLVPCFLINHGHPHELILAQGWTALMA